MSEGFFDGFLDDYFAECEEHLTGARRALLALESSIGDAAAERPVIDELFRYFHSLKGISAMVELRPAEELAHHLEDYLRALRQREVAVTPVGIEVLEQGIQRLGAVIGAHRSKQTPPSTDDLAARIASLAALPGGLAAPAQSASAAASSGERFWTCTFVPTRELMERGIGVDVIRKKLAEVGRIVDAAPRVAPDGTIAFAFTVATTTDDREALDELMADGIVLELAGGAATDGGLLPVAQPLEGTHFGSVAPSHVVRVDMTRLDELIQSVGDLVISRARLVDSLSRIERHVPSAEWRAIQENTLAIDRQLRMLREKIMRVRLVPIGEIFRRMPFVVRDLARESGRKVTLELRGQSTEIDKYLIERMMDPVVHLVRNAVSHGIEPAEERIAKGKPPDGTITLSASTVGEVFTIEVMDDGHGIDAAAVIAQARAVGLPIPLDPSDPQALLALICAPGFSTTADADRVSGRGVGMAVVKSTVEELSGTIRLESTPGVGTRFFIDLPLTLAITDALIGRVGGESFAVPQGAVREVIEIASADVRALEQNEVVPYRGASLPIVRLGKLLGIAEEPVERFHAFVIGTGSAAVGLAVHRVVGHREIVVRAITDPLVKVAGISGATDLGDGRVVLILDPVLIVRLVCDRAARSVGDASTWGRMLA